MLRSSPGRPFQMSWSSSENPDVNSRSAIMAPATGRRSALSVGRKTLRHSHTTQVADQRELQMVRLDVLDSCAHESLLLRTQEGKVGHGEGSVHYSRSYE